MRKTHLAILIGLAIILAPATVFAANPITSGLTISPAIEQLNLGKNQKSISFVSQVTNNTKNQLVVNVSTTDFTAYNETSGIVFLPNLSNRPHGLAQWLKPSVNQIALPPGVSQAVPITITSDNNLAPGGHYGALVYRVIAVGSVAKGNQIGNNEEVSSLIFLTTSSGATQSLSLDKLPVSHFILRIPSSIDLVLANTGNTQAAPHGVVTIVDHSGKEVARGIINPDSGLVLPGTSRLYTVSLQPEAKTLYFGNYHLVVAYQASSTSKTSLYTASFLFVNKSIIVAAAAILGLAVFTLVIRRPATSLIYRQNKR